MVEKFVDLSSQSSPNLSHETLLQVLTRVAIFIVHGIGFGWTGDLNCDGYADLCMGVELIDHVVEEPDARVDGVGRF